MRPLAALSAALSLLAGSAMAAPDDTPIVTCNGAAPAATATQIEEFIRTSPGAQPEAPDPLAPHDKPRKIHGQVSAGVGSHGYRSIGAQAVMPVGKTGTLGVALERSQGPGVLVDPCDYPEAIARPSVCHGPMYRY